MLPEDVVALAQSQERLAEMVPGFKYNLGFSGGKFTSILLTRRQIKSIASGGSTLKEYAPSLDAS